MSIHRTSQLLALTFVASLVGCGGEEAPTPPAEPEAPAEVEAPADPKPETKSTGAYEAIEVTDGGTVSGTVAWDGDKPALDPFPVNKDPGFCDKGGSGTRSSNRLILGTGGGVANAVVYLSDISKGKASTAESSYTLDQNGCDYDPHVQVVPKKSTLTIKSSDTIMHNVHMFGAATYNLPFPDPVSVDKAMRKAGVVRLRCDAGHGWMTAYVHVANHPYYAVTDAKGAFQFEDVPAGTYEIKMWHEHWTVTETTEKDGKVATYEFAEPVEQTQSVTVAAGEAAAVDFKLSGS